MNIYGKYLPAVALCAACSTPPPSGYQGYVEGEFVNVAAPIAGRLDRLAVARGDAIAGGAPLYALEAASEAAAVRQASEEVNAAQAKLADLKQGRRLPEQDVTRAQLAQAQVDEQRTATQQKRDEAQFAIGGIARAQLDDSRAAHAAAQARVAQLASELAVARLPGRNEQIKAQAAQVEAARAALAQAAWRLDQKSVRATQAGLVYDTLYREGEWVAAGGPVVRMLPPANVKVRFFVPEPVVGSLAVGQAVSILCDGCAAEIPARLTYVSNQAEYTPPVIYSNETRAKLVFMVEAKPAAADAPKLHPGQPVSVRLQ
ncbi:MAG: HlyD family efflux transporter periplasmic adaptor subunit [Burkholderiales bacterium]|nr:HlyD family efflux transporter periplasmic adaptor subunit [Burkholderiales bacterium]